MTDQHVAFIVEDDPQIAEILKELVASLGHAWIHASTLEEVRVAVAVGGYCYVLLDMQIPAHATARPLLGSGETALGMIRKKEPRRNEAGAHVLPVLVVTGYSRDPDFVSKMYEMEADGFVAKPFDDRIEFVLDKIRAALLKSGREEHEYCGRIPAPVATSSAPPAALAAPSSPVDAGISASTARGTSGTAPVRLVLDGTQSRKRTRVVVNGGSIDLQDAFFLFLLRVVVAGMQKRVEWATHHELGIARRPELPSRLRAALADFVPAGFEIVESDRDGRYRLNPRVVVEYIDWASLSRHSDPSVQKLAAEAGDTKREAQPARPNAQGARTT